MPLYAGPNCTLSRSLIRSAIDRIDIQIEVPSLHQDELLSASTGEASAAIQQRVSTARGVQVDRQGKTNAMLSSNEIDLYCAPDAAGMSLLKNAIIRLNLSARAYHRILKVARTVADLSLHPTSQVNILLKPYNIAD